MTGVSNDILTIAIVALIVAAILVFLLLRSRRQRVSLSDNTPVRPYMSNSQDSPKEGNDIASGAAAATSDVAGQIIDTPVHDSLINGHATEADDFRRMKGVGPKFAQTLIERGFTRFDQLASLSSEEIERLDPQLGAFRGRIQRDRIVEQAAYLARGDQDGFEQKFGKL
jgi:predicted flap endonuclease-1-like 5' DNA nuclease